MINKDTLYIKLTALAGLGIRELNPLITNYGLKHSIYRNGGSIFMKSILTDLISSNKDKILSRINILNEMTFKDKFSHKYLTAYKELFRLGITTYQQLVKLGLKRSRSREYMFRVAYTMYYREMPQNMLKNIITDINSTLTPSIPDNKLNINNTINKYKNTL